MRIVDGRWTDLATGYQTVQSLQDKLEAEFGRAIQIGHRQKFRKELTEWQKKRRIFFVMAAFAPLSVIALCVSAFYFHDVACLIAYWIVVVLTILVALAVAGRNYIREAVNRPQPGRVETRVVDLEQRWWDCLAPKELALGKPGHKGGADFLALLDHSLSEEYIACRSPSPAEGGSVEADILLLGPSGIWVFVVRGWDGTVTKQDGVWRQVQTLRDKLGRKKRIEKVHEQSPDDRWLHLKRELAATIGTRLPGLAWTVDLLQGGLVFSHPKVTLDKEQINGHMAAFGPVGAWLERLRAAQAKDGFTLDVQLQVLDEWTDSVNLGGEGRVESSSARLEAERLYQEAVQELRQVVAKMMK